MLQSKEQSDTVSATSGIDTAGAITLLSGNKALYGQIAQAFLDEIQTLPARVAPLLQAPDPAEAVRALHTIKGLALTVGAVQLGETCRAGEKLLKAERLPGQVDGADRTHFLARLQTEVASTTLAMQLALKTLDMTAENAANNGTQPDAHELIGDLQQLATLLAQSDMRAVDAHTQLRRKHSAALDARFEPLNSALQAFDFERGVVQCETLLSGLAPITKND